MLSGLCDGKSKLAETSVPFTYGGGAIFPKDSVCSFLSLTLQNYSCIYSMTRGYWEQLSGLASSKGCCTC